MDTSQQIDGFTIDANRISRLRFMQLTAEMDAARASNDLLKVVQLQAEMIEAMVVAWPFSGVISVKNYLDLGLVDSRRVDAALDQAMEDIAKKK